MYLSILFTTLFSIRRCVLNELGTPFKSTSLDTVLGCHVPHQCWWGLLVMSPDLRQHGINTSPTLTRISTTITTTTKFGGFGKKFLSRIRRQARAAKNLCFIQEKSAAFGLRATRTLLSQERQSTLFDLRTWVWFAAAISRVSPFIIRSKLID